MIDKTKSLAVITDPGVDDMVGLVLLSKLHQASITLYSTFGNANAEITYQNASDFLAFTFLEWSLIQGAILPVTGKVEHAWPDYFHGPDGIWNVRPPAKNNRSIKVNGDVRIASQAISLSPLTTLLQLERSQVFQNVSIMGGAFFIEGNETRYAETNIAFDVDAAADYFESTATLNKIVPLDVTRKVVWSRNLVENIPETNPVNIWLKRLVLAWFDNYNHDKEKDFNLHDPLAVFLSYFPEYAKWQEGLVSIEQFTERRGKTTLQTGTNQRDQVAIAIDDPSKVARIIYDILFL